MDYNELNKLLKRPLKDGSRYNRYFENSSCSPFYMGKSDTAFTVRQMVKMVNKNAAYVKALALGEFTNRSLQRTCEMIHDFLFNHVQYELDDEDQLLRSPQCSWASREIGIDCKSYSIFASAILKNLGIKHVLRRVKQPNPDFEITKKGINPSLWSHIYVVVPKNQSTLKVDSPDDYFIIDATVEGNLEGAFSKKHDTKMTKVSLRHYGLQAPARVHGMGGCTCTAKPKEVVTTTIKPVLPSQPKYVSNTRNVEALQRLQFEKMRKETVGFNGSIHSPWLAHGLGSSSLFVNGDNETKNSTQVANDYTTFALQAYQAGKQGAAANAASISQGTKKQRLNAIGKNGATSATIKAIGAGAAAYTYGISALLALVPSEWYEKVLGQWFSGGFKCIGSTWTKKTALQAANIENEYLRNEAILVIHKMQEATVEEIEQGINDFVEYFYSIQSTSRDWLKTSAKDCTKKGLILMIKTLDEGLKSYMAMFSKSITQAGHAVVKTGTFKTVKYPPESHSGRHALTQKIPQYEIKLNPEVLRQIQAQEASKGNVLPIEPKNKKKISTKSVVGIAAMAGLAYISI